MALGDKLKALKYLYDHNALSKLHADEFFRDPEVIAALPADPPPEEPPEEDPPPP